MNSFEAAFIVGLLLLGAASCTSPQAGTEVPARIKLPNKEVTRQERG